MADQRIEEELAYLRRATEEMSEVVSAQADQIDRLSRRVQMLMERAAAQESDASGGVVIADEQPPHY